MKRIILIACALLHVSAFAYSQPLGSRIDLSEVEASKGLKFTICPPAGWEIREPSYPDALVEFVDKSTGNSMNIVVTRFATFLSKNEFKSLKEDFSAEQEKQFEGWAGLPISSRHELIEIDSYPFLKSTFTTFVNTNSRGLIPYRTVMYIGVIEDLLVTITGAEYNYSASSNKFLNLFDRVAWSARFPEQYEYINATR